MVNEAILTAENYNLDATLGSGQTFQFTRTGTGDWEGVIGSQWVSLRSHTQGIQVRFAPGSAGPGHGPDLAPVEEFLQNRVNLEAILETFPRDGVLLKATRACQGLRLLKQDPWQCLASFILSSTKQIVQIEQIVRTLSARYGARVPAGHGTNSCHAFPRPEVLAECTETELRQCKLGFRAPYLLEAARAVARGQINFAGLATLPLQEARATLMALHGVGRKIADCALLFSGCQPGSFPVDVWIARALRRHYFKNADIPLKKLEQFAESHFGPNAGYAQQYLFHYTRVLDIPVESARGRSRKPRS